MELVIPVMKLVSILPLNGISRLTYEGKNYIKRCHIHAAFLERILKNRALYKYYESETVELLLKRVFETGIIRF